MSSNLKNFDNAIWNCKQASKRHYLGVFKAITTLPVTKYFPNDHEDETNATDMNQDYDVQHIIVCASSQYGRGFFDSTL